MNNKHLVEIANRILPIKIAQAKEIINPETELSVQDQLRRFETNVPATN